MKRLPIPVFLLSLLLIATACSMPYIADIPEWMPGDWDIFSESGEYIGRCEISINKIEVTIDLYGYNKFDIFADAMQNGGKTEEQGDTYSIFFGIANSSYYKFIKLDNDNIEMVLSKNYSLEETFMLRRDS